MEEKNQKQLNIGIALLRFLMCFEVVLCHFWNQNPVPVYLRPFQMLQYLAVPVFMLMSFFLIEKVLLSKDKTLLKQRIIRLLIPQIIWTIIYWVFFYFIGRASISDFFWQLFTGHSPHLNPTMWYQIDLILLTVLFAFLFYVFPKKAIFISFGLLCASLALQYTGINYSFLSPLPDELKYTLGRLVETLPYAVVGISLSYYAVFDHLKHMMFFILISTALIVVGFLLNKLFPTTGFQYSGMPYILIGVSLFILFYLLPFNKMPTVLSTSILVCSKYTLGIYCMHRLIGFILNKLFLFLGFPKLTFAGCIVIYICSYFVSFVIAHMPTKIGKKIVE